MVICIAVPIIFVSLYTLFHVLPSETGNGGGEHVLARGTTADLRSNSVLRCSYKTVKWTKQHHRTIESNGSPRRDQNNNNNNNDNNNDSRTPQTNTKASSKQKARQSTQQETSQSEQRVDIEKESREQQNESYQIESNRIESNQPLKHA
jgi:hypothetical protein